MSLPIYLPYGIVSIYGIGSSTSSTDIVPPPTFLFGQVDQVSQYGIEWAQVGDSVLFPNGDVKCRLEYADWRYTIIEEAKLILREIIPP